jgi:hypothetical protein
VIKVERHEGASFTLLPRFTLMLIPTCSTRDLHPFHSSNHLLRLGLHRSRPSLTSASRFDTQMRIIIGVAIAVIIVIIVVSIVKATQNK